MVPLHEKEQWLPVIRGERGRQIRQSKKILRAVKLLWMILQWWIHVLIHLSQPIECPTPRVNPNVNCGLWVIMACRVGHHGNKWAISWEMLIVGKAVPVLGEECLYSFHSVLLCVNSKIRSLLIFKKKKAISILLLKYWAIKEILNVLVTGYT